MLGDIINSDYYTVLECRLYYIIGLIHTVPDGCLTAMLPHIKYCIVLTLCYILYIDYCLMRSYYLLQQAIT